MEEWARWPPSFFIRCSVEKTVRATAIRTISTPEYLVMLRCRTVQRLCLSGDEEKIDLISKKMYEDARLLEELGCLAIGVTCNTAHYFVDMISDKIGIPFIHMIKETAKETAKTLKNEKVGILATDGTIETKLYQNALRDEGVIPCTLDSHGQGLVMHEIYDRQEKAGLASEDESWQEIDEKLKEMGCKKALLACTELSVIKNERKLSDYYVDPVEVMADKTLKFMKKNQIKHI